jgi:hypothetical protein
MATPDIDTVLEWRGRKVVDRSGEEIGTLEEIFLDAHSDLPEWGSIRGGLLGRRQSLLPLSEVEPAEGDALRVPFDKSHVLAAPQAEPEVELSAEEEDALYRHYGREPGPSGATDDAMTRSEEEVDVRAEARPRERVRLKKYVVTEHVTKTVPVKREKVKLEREPVTEDDDG